MTTVPCPACAKDVPGGKFCSLCGVRLPPDSVGGPLRLSAYAAAPRERVIRPWVTTALFPQLPPRSRAVFRLGLIVMTVAAAGFAALGWKVAVIVASVVGLPVLFAAYLREITIRRAIPGRHLALAAVFALALGAGWQFVTGPMVDDAYYAEMGGLLTADQLFWCGVVVPMTFAFVLVAPAALVRALNRSRGEALDGFTIGAVGATLVNAASTAVYVAPQLTAGRSAGSQPADSLLAEVLVEGVAWPLGSAAVGGLFGLALWFTPRANAARRYHKAAILPAAFLAALAFAVVMGFVDVASMPMSVYVALQVPIALAAVLAMRAAVADALLHEAPDDTVHGQRRCAECDHVADREAFCSDCGVAVRASSRTSRAAREVPPEPSGHPVAAEVTAGRPQPMTKYRSVLGPVAAGVGIPVVAAVLVSALFAPAPAAYVCPPDCGHPPLGSPVETNPRYSGDDGAFSVSFPGEGTAYEVTFDPPGMNGVQAKYVGGDTGLLNLFGEPARGRTPKQVAEDVLKSKFPDAIVEYPIPNASVGYEPGYGVVADVFSRGTRLRVIVMAAVRYDYALIATAAGPFHQFSQDYGTGHPSSANLEVAMDIGKYINSFRWSGDRRKRPQ